MKLSVEFVPYILEQRTREIACFLPGEEDEYNQLRLAALHEVIEVITSYTSPGTEVTWLATMSYRKVKGLLRNDDPYRKIKSEEKILAKKLVDKYLKRYMEEDIDVAKKLEVFVKASAIASALNLMCENNVDQIERELEEIQEFKVKGLEPKALVETLREARIAFIPCGVGEFLFDLQLIKILTSDLGARVRIYVKTGAYMNHLTYGEVLEGFTLPENTQVIPLQTDAAGVDKSLISKGELDDIASNDIIIAKGVMNYCGLHNSGIKTPAYVIMRPDALPLYRTLGVARLEAVIVRVI